MKREIDGYVYDTANASVIASHETGTTHIQRLSTLYRSAEGRYFIVEEQERYGVYGALLTPSTDAMAQKWLEDHGKTDLAGSLFKNAKTFLRVEMDLDLLRRIDAAAGAAGLSKEAWVNGAIEGALADAVSPAQRDRGGA